MHIFEILEWNNSIKKRQLTHRYFKKSSIILLKSHDQWIIKKWIRVYRSPRSISEALCTIYSYFHTEFRDRWFKDSIFTLKISHNWLQTLCSRYHFKSSKIRKWTRNNCLQKSLRFRWPRRGDAQLLRHIEMGWELGDWNHSHYRHQSHRTQWEWSFQYSFW